MVACKSQGLLSSYVRSFSEDQLQLRRDCLQLGVFAERCKPLLVLQPKLACPSGPLEEEESSEFQSLYFRKVSPRETQGFCSEGERSHHWRGAVALLLESGDRGGLPSLRPRV